MRGFPRTRRRSAGDISTPDDDTGCRSIRGHVDDRREHADAGAPCGSSVVFALLGAAATAAVIAAPAVAFFDRWVPRGLAILLVTLAGIGTTVGLLGLVAWDLDRQAGTVTRSISETIADLPADSSAAELMADLEVERRVDSVLNGAAARVAIGDTDPLAVAAQVGKVVLVAVIAAFLIAGGRKLLSAGIRHVRRQSIREPVSVALTVVGAVALLQIMRDVCPLILWLAVALFIAFGLDRPISFMHRKWTILRAAGIALVLGAVAGLVSLVVVLAGPSITDSSRTIAADAPETVESLESLPLVGKFLDSNEA